MKIIALTDLHGRTASFSPLEDRIGSADLVLLCGDITHFGHEKEAESMITALRAINPAVLAVSGNCDNSGVEVYLSREHMTLFGIVRVIGGIAFAGMSGSLPCPGPTPNEYSEEEFEAILAGVNPPAEMPFILVSHQPPYGTVNDQVSPGTHVGSRALRRFIEKTAPLVCFTGHIHEGIGKSHISTTAVVNPGPAFNGGYAVAEIEGGSVTELSVMKIPQ